MGREDQQPHFELRPEKKMVSDATRLLESSDTGQMMMKTVYHVERIADIT
jgi:hypothetical protein